MMARAGRVDTDRNKLNTAVVRLQLVRLLLEARDDDLASDVEETPLSRM